MFKVGDLVYVKGQIWNPDWVECKLCRGATEIYIPHKELREDFTIIDCPECGGKGQTRSMTGEKETWKDHPYRVKIQEIFKLSDESEALVYVVADIQENWSAGRSFAGKHSNVFATAKEAMEVWDTSIRVI